MEEIRCDDFSCNLPFDYAGSLHYSAYNKMQTITNQKAIYHLITDTATHVDRVVVKGQKNVLCGTVDARC